MGRLEAYPSCSVNEIFDADKVSPFYDLPKPTRSAIIAENKSTNYSVVRSELLDRLYEKLYHQRLHSKTEEAWPHRIIPLSELHKVQSRSDGRLDLTFVNPRSGQRSHAEGIDLVIFGTGYSRDAYKKILQGTKHLMENSDYHIERDYKLKLSRDFVSEDCGIWLQGCKCAHFVRRPSTLI